jgi:fimbrial chaperone protein
MKLFKKEIFLILSIALPAIAAAGEFQVSPIMLDLGKAARNGVITVSNVGNETINLQVEARETGLRGENAYTKTGDVFSKIMSLKKDAQLIRVGMRACLLRLKATGSTFRRSLYRKTEKGKAEIGIAIRFGVPIFIKPVNEEMKGIIENGSMTKGRQNAS